ncbi:MAG: hypothetical protein M1412_01985 [Deltaproteobacteria bacterium]|nr:hypothetical protein [Deltaproteobacteria bacterium]MCL5891926.1 hypothetical protein [Deltaproteobacteria bacterium]
MKFKKHLFIYVFSLFILIAGISFSAKASYALLKWQADYAKAVGLLKNKKYNSALKISKEALIESKNPETYELVANVLQFLKEYKLSTHYYKRSLAEVLKLNENNKNTGKFIDSVKNSIALNYLLRGNNFLKSGKIDPAVMLYKKGLKYANDRHLSDILMLNTAMGYENSKPNHFRKALYYSNNVIKNNSKNSYAYFIKGRAEYGIDELDLSLQDLKTAYKLNPKNRFIQSAIKMVKKDIYYKKHKEMSRIKQSSKNLFK